MLGSGGGGVGSSGVTAPAAAGPTEGGSNSEAVAAAAAASSIFGNLNNNNPGEDDKGTVDDGGSGGFGGNRWPRQETLALLKIRSDMEAVFREASVKGPLWEEVSRKLAELGYHRNAKKCKEKFENVYKYHKRTKDGRSGKQEGKSYRFFDQLEALEKIASPSSSSAAPPPPRPIVTTTAPMAAPNTVPSSTVLSFAQNTPNSPNLIQPQNPVIQPPPLPPPPIPPPPIPPPQPPPQAAVNAATPPQNFPQNVSFPADLMMSNSTSSSTSSDMDLGGGRQKRRRKWKDFFERLMREVTEKQEEMQRKFLEAIEKKEQERMMREEAWKMQEITRINREREILAQERSSAAAKDAAVMAFLQKIAEKQNYQNNPPQPVPAPPPPQPPQQQQQTTPAPVPVPVPVHQQQTTPAPVPVTVPVPALALQRTSSAPRNTTEQLPPPQGDNNELISSNSLMSPSRWPKVEIEALIKLRTNLDAKYQDNSPKGPLWEEISAAMKRLGYNRNAKRCKEKWENINKYFKKVKESNKKRPEDSKTCPYFAQLDALYRERNKIGGASSEMTKAENSIPLMVRPEQQWPPAAGASGQENRDFAMEEMESEREDGDEEMEEDEGSDQFEVVASKPVSMGKTGE